MQTLMTHTAKRGFTLIEILIVIAIIGVLASVVLVGLGPSQRQGRDARRLSDLRQVQNALELYFTRCGFFPDPNGARASPQCAASGAGTWTELVGTLTTGGIGVAQIPNDPVSGRTYQYEARPDLTSYILRADLEVTNTALDTDIDGTPTGFTIDCGAPGDNTTDFYCLQF